MMAKLLYWAASLCLCNQLHASLSTNQLIYLLDFDAAGTPEKLVTGTGNVPFTRETPVRITPGGFVHHETIPVIYAPRAEPGTACKFPMGMACPCPAGIFPFHSTSAIMREEALYSPLTGLPSTAAGPSGEQEAPAPAPGKKNPAIPVPSLRQFPPGMSGIPWCIPFTIRL